MYVLRGAETNAIAEREDLGSRQHPSINTTTNTIGYRTKVAQPPIKTISLAENGPGAAICRLANLPLPNQDLFSSNRTTPYPTKVYLRLFLIIQSQTTPISYPFLLFRTVKIGSGN